MYALLDATGLSSVVSALTTGISTETMLTNLGTIIPFVAGIVIFAFTYRIIKKAVKGASKGKANM